MKTGTVSFFDVAVTDVTTQLLLVLLINRAFGVRASNLSISWARSPA